MMMTKIECCLLLAVAALLLVPACNGDGSGGPKTDSETHWLLSCGSDDDCSDGASCACGVCSSPCNAGDSCLLGDEELAGTCLAPREVAAACDTTALGDDNGLCAPECVSDDDCADNDPPLRCQAGSCRPTSVDDSRCTSNDDCDTGQFCALAVGCSGQGVCTDVPDSCTLEVAEVCGCDGQTYSNACAAESEGVNVERQGACEVVGNECGGFAGLECEADEYCFYGENMCGIADGLGTCLPRPDACALILDPVCGCDGETYDNACEANMNGVDAIGSGACQSSCMIASDCSGTHYCDFDSDGACLIFDVFGTCQPRPEECTTEVDPVCGCDQVTYNNRCDAAAAGVDVAATGTCQ